MSKRQRILLIITRLDKGGSAEGVLQIAAHLDQENTVLLSGATYDPEGKIKRFIDEKNISLFLVSELIREINFFKDFTAFRKIFRYIKKEKFDIVHTNSSKAGILGRWAAWLAGTRVIIHTPHGHVFYGYFGRLKSSIFVFVERLTAVITDKIITLTEKGIKDHVQYGIAPPERFTAISCGIDMDKYRFREPSPEKRKELGIPEDKIVVGTVSRLDPVKGNRYFIEAIKEIRNRRHKIWDNTVFLIVGDGTEGDELKRLAGKYGINDKVIFTGMRDDVPEIFPLVDVFVLSSVMEGMGKVLLQVMMCGKPVVATSVGGVPELIRNGKNGILVEPKDPVAMAEAIIRLVMDKDLRKRMGEAGMGFVNETVNGCPKFSVQFMVKKLKELYEHYN